MTLYEYLEATRRDWKREQEELVLSVMGDIADDSTRRLSPISIREIYQAARPDLTYPELQRALSRLEATQRVTRCSGRNGKPVRPRSYEAVRHRGRSG